MFRRMVVAGLMLSLAVTCCLPTAGVGAEKSWKAETKAQRDARMQWWREARFGLFIHWGLYAVPAGMWKGKKIPGIGEWIMNRAKIPVPVYEKLAKKFNPVRFNARAWVKVAKDAGIDLIGLPALDGRTGLVLGELGGPHGVEVAVRQPRRIPDQGRRVIGNTDEGPGHARRAGPGSRDVDEQVVVLRRGGAAHGNRQKNQKHGFGDR